MRRVFGEFDNSAHRRKMSKKIIDFALLMCYNNMYRGRKAIDLKKRMGCNGQYLKTPKAERSAFQ